MKGFFAVVLLSLLSFAALAFEKPSSHYCMPNSSQISCQLELALVCGPNYKDGCLTGQSTVHKCILQPSGELCRVPVQLLCIAGLRDGCDTGKTTRHECVPYIGPTCDTNDGFTCPEGFHDTCNQ